jgi:hypothetical protein
MLNLIFAWLVEAYFFGELILMQPMIGILSGYRANESSSVLKIWHPSVRTLFITSVRSSVTAFPSLPWQNGQALTDPSESI